MAQKPSTPKIRVGPAGWSYKDWIGIVYWALGQFPAKIHSQNPHL
jgi:hypothetical protein